MAGEEKARTRNMGTGYVLEKSYPAAGEPDWEAEAGRLYLVASKWARRTGQRNRALATAEAALVDAARALPDGATRRKVRRAAEVCRKARVSK